MDPRDGSFWVSLSDGRTSSPPNSPVPGLFHLAADGTGLGQIPGVGAYLSDSLAIDPTDGSLWVGENYPAVRLAHFAANGAELWHDVNASGDSPSVNITDGSCWTSGGAGIEHFAKDGTLLANISTHASRLAVDPVTGFCWAISNMSLDGNYVRVYDAKGWQLWTGGGLQRAYYIQLSVRDGSVWTDSLGQGQTVHLWVPVTVFPDVLYDNWAAYGVSLCFRAGIVGGYSDGNYHPEYVVSRAQMAIFVSRALAKGDKNVPPGPAIAAFPDVPTDYWAFKYVEYAHANNIVQGYGNGNYGPEDSLDRSQMAVFLARSMVTPHGDAGLASYVPPTTPSFPDVPADFWAFKHVEYIKSQNVPKATRMGSTTRATCARGIRWRCL